MCPKCGEKKDIYKIYHKNGYKCSYGSNDERMDEHLHYFCRSCSYDWCGDVFKFKLTKEKV